MAQTALVRTLHRQRHHERTQELDGQQLSLSTLWKYKYGLYPQHLALSSPATSLVQQDHKCSWPSESGRLRAGGPAGRASEVGATQGQCGTGTGAPDQHPASHSSVGLRPEHLQQPPGAQGRSFLAVWCWGSSPVVSHGYMRLGPGLHVARIEAPVPRSRSL